MPVTINEDEFGYTRDPISGEGQSVKRFTFSNENGLCIQVITYGATITSIRCPDKYGNIEDIALGFDELDGYRSAPNPYFGASVGRVCNRIGNGRFRLNGKTYEVDKNLSGGKHQLHGGTIGFDKFNWSAFRSGSKVIMTHVNPDKFQGYPGTVIANVTYELLPDDTFSGIFSATVSEPTPINLTNHSYFNLAGHDKGHIEIYNHVVTLNADKITVTDDNSIPTGVLQDVDTLYDLRIARKLGDALSKLSNSGYDDNFCVTQGSDQSLTFVAKVSHPKSGRTLEVYSDQPGVQFYTSNNMPDPTNSIYPEGKLHEKNAGSDATEPIFGKQGALYFKHGAFCLETQNYPDAVNHINFPNSIVNPGDMYRHQFLYKFKIDKN